MSLFIYLARAAIQLDNLFPNFADNLRNFYLEGILKQMFNEALLWSCFKYKGDF